MLNEEQQNAEITVTGGQVVVALQVISRLVSNGGLRDVELSPVGTARDGLVAALESATGVNFDQEKARQEAIQLQRIAQARQQYAEAQAAAAAAAEAEASEEAPAAEEDDSQAPADVAVS